MLSDTLKALRKNRQLSQADLAKILGVSRPAIVHYERGDRSPDFKTLMRIATYFNVSTDYLLGLSCEASSVSSNNSIKQDERIEKALELLEKFEQLPYDKQRAIEILIGMSEQAATRLPEAK